MLICGARERLRIKTARPARPLRRGVFRAVAMLVVMLIAGPPGSALAQAHVSPAGDPAKCMPFPGNLQLNPRFPVPKPPPGSKVFHQPQPACGYLAGFAGVRKLDGTVPVGPGLSDLRLGLTTYTNFNRSYSYFQQEVAGQFGYHGKPELPPARATFQVFGYIPVSVTIHISEIGSFNLSLVSCTPASKCPNHPANAALLSGRVTLRLANVEIDGVPVDVGPHCQTAKPFNLVLTGLPPAYNVNLIQGVLTGTVTIPPFKGCASGGYDLDPVFTASVSGPGNLVKISQAPICTPKTGGGCPPVRPGPVSSQTGSASTASGNDT